jgi:aldose 1-epimerase
LSAADGTAVVLWADPVFRWAQVFSPDSFPGPGMPDQRIALAVEPMTCAVDALNSGDGLLWLQPGDTWSASWGLRPEGF